MILSTPLSLGEHFLAYLHLCCYVLKFPVLQGLYSSPHFHFHAAMNQEPDETSPLPESNDDGQPEASESSEMTDTRNPQAEADGEGSLAPKEQEAEENNGEEKKMGVASTLSTIWTKSVGESSIQRSPSSLWWRSRPFLPISLLKLSS